MNEKTTHKNKEPASGKKTVTILLLLIFSGIVLYMSFILLANFQAYKEISKNLKIELQSKYNQYLGLNYTTVNNVIHINNYNYIQTIKALGAILGNITATTEYSCEINGIVYQFDTIFENDTSRISGYHAYLSPAAEQAASKSFVVAETYSQRF